MVILLIILIILVFYLLLTYIMFILASRKIGNNVVPYPKSMTKEIESHKELWDKGNEWIEEQQNKNLVKDVYIKSFDNLKLHGIFIEHENSKGIIIECHGYRSIPKRDLFASCYKYHEMGYSLLIIDNRTCGLSEGKYTTFGVHESKDIIAWVKFLNAEYPDKEIVLAGISMGASSVLMALKDITSDMHIKCAIADSGYISPYDEVLYCIKHHFHLHGKLYIHAINDWCKLFAKFSLNEIDTITAIKDVNIPILFVHGLEDDLVPPSNSIENYNNYNGPKSLELYENAIHGIGYLVDPERYIKSVENILSK